jgi:hypothetical protein
MSDDRVREAAAQVARENFHPDAGVRAERRAKRLERELAEHRRHADEVHRLLQEQTRALAEMLDCLWRALPVDRRPQ